MGFEVDHIDDFRQAAWSILVVGRLQESQLHARTNVAFEIDDIDHEHGTGWSVVVRGTAQGIAQARSLERLWTSEVTVPWAAGTRNLFIAITTIAGRVVHRPWSTGSGT